MKRLLVTSAGSGATDNLVSSLRRAALPFYLVGTSIDRYCLARSKTDCNYLVPRVDSGARYLEALQGIARQDALDLIIPNTDLEVHAISAARAQLGAPVFLPAHATIELCQDKLRLTRTLAAQGLPVAPTFPVESPERAAEVFARFDQPDSLWCRLRRGSGSRGSLPVRSPEQAAAWIDYWQKMRGIPEGMFLLCEYLPGRDFAVQMLWNEGQLVLAKACERLHYLFAGLMASGSSSTPRVARTTRNAIVMETCLATVRAIDPAAQGLFCVDLKENARGVPCVTEINIGRFFMITSLFDRVGRHNMAEVFVHLALGETLSIEEDERLDDIGPETAYLIREIDHEPEVLTAGEIEQRHRVWTPEPTALELESRP